MRCTLTLTIMALSIFLISCGSRDTNENNSSGGVQSQTGGQGLSSGSGQDNSNGTGDSVAGLWDMSTLTETFYEFWTDNGVFTIYDYQGDGSGSGQNCFEAEEVIYTRVDNEFTFDGRTSTVIRSGDTLSIEGVPFPLVTAITVADLELCI